MTTYKYEFKIILEHKVTMPNAWGVVRPFRFVIAEVEGSRWYVGEANQRGEPMSFGAYYYLETKEDALNRFNHYVKKFPIKGVIQ